MLRNVALALLLFVGALDSLLYAAPEEPPRPVLEAGRAHGFAPTIDGFLDDGIWERDPLTMTTWKSYDPIRGEPMALRTDVWIAHDDQYLYFAFRCYDDEPEKIRTTISRRDNVFGDDWVGLSLDSFGTGQTAYHLMVNPSGIQMDALNSTASGEQWAADFVWDSAGQITDGGYQTEIRVPLQSIRFNGGEDVRMGVMFWRRISRMGVSSAWPELLPGQWVFDSHAELIFDDIEQPMLLEVIPSVTNSLNQNRLSPEQWSPASNDPQVGISLKYGLTSSITLEGTFNPDFSQVESDAFQNQVNTRFATFFDEKRPFFMEGNSLFSIAGAGGESNMRTAVHTRKIVDPNAGVKLAGTSGSLNFGFLSAADEAPGRVFDEDHTNPYAGEKRYFNIGRAQYSFGQASYVGGIVTDTRLGEGYNQVRGADASIRIDPRQRISMTFLDSDTRSEDGLEVKQGRSAQFTYNFDSLPFRVFTQAEHYDEDFDMQTAFLNRTGITAVKGFSEAPFYPAAGWLKKIAPTVWFQRANDRINDGVEWAIQPGVQMNFSKQGYAGFNVRQGREPWLGTTYERTWVNAWGGAQFTKSVNVNGWIQAGKSIFYDREDPFQGHSTSGGLNVTLQPNEKINQNISYTNVRFDRSSTGDRVFDVHILNARTRYQFNRHFFLRSIIQYDSSAERVLTDFLASYQLVPGTVVHFGYSALLEQRDFKDGRWVSGEGDYLTTNRGLFFKASYLYRF